MKRFFTRNYWLCLREDFIRWLASDYIEHEQQCFERYCAIVKITDERRDAELLKFAKMAETFSGALATISRLHQNHPACEIAFCALNPGARFPIRPVVGISLAEFKAANPLPINAHGPTPAALPASPPPSGESAGGVGAGPTPPPA